MSDEYLKPPSSEQWRIFEIICKRFFSNCYSKDFEEFGRRGQNQQGLDLVCFEPSNTIGIQCKCYDRALLTKIEINDIVKEAKSFRPPLSKLIIATTKSIDANLQQLSYEISEFNIQNGLFKLEIWFWERISEKIQKEYPALISEFDLIKQPSFTTQQTIGNLSFIGDLIKRYKVDTALEFLSEIKSKYWESMSNPEKYLFLKHQGTALLEINDYENGAERLIEAQKLMTNDEDALCNAAIGFLILENNIKCSELAKKALEINEFSEKAYKSIILAEDLSKPIVNIIQNIPAHLLNKPILAISLAYAAINRKNISDAVKWARIAVDNDEEKKPNNCASLAEFLLGSVSYCFDAFPKIILSRSEESIIREVICLLTLAWSKIEKTEMRKYRNVWLLKRGMARCFTGNIEEGIKDIEEGIKDEVKDKALLKSVAWMLCDIGKSETALNLLENEFDATDEDADVFRANIFISRKDVESRERAKNILINLFNNKSSNNRFLIGYNLADIYLSNNEFNKVLDIVEIFDRDCICSVISWIIKSRLSKLESNNDEVKERLNNAFNEIRSDTSEVVLEILADELMESKMYEDAAEVLEKISDVTKYSKETKMLIDCYYLIGQGDKALEIMRKLRFIYGPLKDITSNEISILEEVNDIEEAKRVYLEFIKVFPDEIDKEIRLAYLNFYSGENDEVNKCLLKMPNSNKLSMRHGIAISELYMLIGLIQKAIEIMYDIRRMNLTEKDAHLRYINIFVKREDDLAEDLTHNCVKHNSVVKLKEKNGQEIIRIIEAGEIIDNTKEISPTNDISKLLIGKHLNETIQNGNIDYLIIDIKSKYVTALQESLEQYNLFFPGDSTIRGFSFDENDIKESLKQLIKILGINDKREDNILNMYHDWRFPIITLEKSIGSGSIYEFIYDLSEDELFGIHAFRVNRGEYESAKNILQKNPLLFLDSSSLITIHRIGAESAILKEFNTIGFCNSMLKELINLQEESRSYTRRKFLFKDESIIISRIRVNGENVNTWLEYYSKLIEWIRTNCKLLPSRGKLRIDKNEKANLERLFGETYVDLIFAARDFQGVICSDDALIRDIARNDFGVSGAWTQAILVELLKREVISKDVYRDYVMKLLDMNYRHIMLDPYTLLYAAQEECWHISGKLEKAINVLEYLTPESGIAISTEFLYMLCQQKIFDHQLISITLSIIEILIKNRERHVIIRALKERISRRSVLLLPQRVNLILQIIDDYMRAKPF